MASSAKAGHHVEGLNATDQSWLVTLRRWLVECPACAEVRLVVGVRENDRYQCKQCGHDFTIVRTGPDFKS